MNEPTLDDYFEQIAQNTVTFVEREKGEIAEYAKELLMQGSKIAAHQIFANLKKMTLAVDDGPLLTLAVIRGYE